jgi:hypothetical protein
MNLARVIVVVTDPVMEDPRSSPPSSTGRGLPREDWGEAATDPEELGGGPWLHIEPRRRAGRPIVGF